jgi:hypothetical protein
VLLGELNPGFAFAGGAGGQHGVRAIALALEGIAGKGKTVAGVVVVESGPVDSEAMRPGFAKGLEKGSIFVGSLVFGRRKQGEGSAVGGSGVLFCQWGEGSARADFEEEGGTSLAQGGDAISETDGLTDVLDVVVRIGSLGFSDGLTGEV